MLATAVPANAAPRPRPYRGQTFQEQNVRFVVAKTDTDRFVRQISLSATLTREDQTTLGWGIQFNFGRKQVPITDKAFAYDENLGIWPSTWPANWDRSKVRARRR